MMKRTNNRSAKRAATRKPTGKGNAAESARARDANKRSAGGRGAEIAVAEHSGNSAGSQVRIAAKFAVGGLPGPPPSAVAGAAGDALTLAGLVPDPANRRQHTPRNLGMIADSLQAVGVARSIVIDEHNEILAGNGLVEAATAAGLTKVHVVEADGDTVIAVRRRGLSAEQKRSLALFDNRSAELAAWNVERLKIDSVEGLELKPFFFDTEVATLFGNTPPARGKTDPDAVPRERSKTTIAPGDLFALGPHRILCGDCTKPTDIARLLEGDKVQLVVTDPPYAIYGSSTGIGSDIADDKMVRAFFLDILKLADVLEVFGHFYVCCDWRSWPSWWEMAKRAELTPKNLIIWDKHNSGLGSSYANTYEAIGFFAKLPRQTVMRSGQRSGQRQVHKPNLWRGNRVTGDEREHNAQKPVELMQFLIDNSSDAGDLVLEPFAGSGTTLIAAHALGRRCYALEIEPRYCQLVIDRWEAFTGDKAARIDGHV
jgi:DNA modification methylase